MVEAVAVLEKEKMPFVVFGRRIEDPDVSYIAPDNQDGAYRLTTHLIEQGHRRIGFTTRPQLGTVSEDRFTGYRHALDEAGIPFDPDLIVETVIEPRSGCRALEALLKLPDPPTAMFAFYDLMAVDAAQAAQERKERVNNLAGREPAELIHAPRGVFQLQKFQNPAFELASVDFVQAHGSI